MSSTKKNRPHSKPVVSVIIPTYNRREDLSRALQSVISQTFQDWEAIVVDNHSSDGTEQLVSEIADARIRFFRIRNHGIIAKSRNTGIRKSRGDFIALLDSDDWWTPRKLELSVAALHGGADVTFHDMYIARRKKQNFFMRRAKTRSLSEPVFEDLLLKGNGIITSSVVIRRAIMKRAGFMNERKDYIAWEDFDYWLRISRVTQKFCRLGPTLGYYWMGGGNTTNDGRILSNMENIEKAYAGAISALSQGNEISWMSYARAKAYFRLNLNKEAVRYLNMILFRNAPLFWKAVSTYLHFRIFARTVFSGHQKSENPR